MKKVSALLGATMLAAVSATPAQALKIDLNNVNNISTSSDAYKGFRAAADFWEKMITTNVTVLFNVEFRSTGFSSASVIGSTSSTAFTGVLVQDVYEALAANKGSRLDGIAAKNMSSLTQVASIYGGTTGAVSAITQQGKPGGAGYLYNTRTPAPGGTTAQSLNGVETASFREWDNDGTRNNYDLRTNAANLKALGYNLADTSYSCANRVNTAACNADPTRIAGGRGIDAKIAFNSAFAFDFNSNDGIDAGKQDFVGVAIHEFGHALGFTSGVDIWDNTANSAAVRMDTQALQSVWDLFRYSDDVNNVAPGTGQVLDWSVGNSAVVGNNTRGRAYFSFDGQTKGLSAYGGDEGYLSTGAANGDGRQASHWMDTPYVALPGNSPTTQCLRPSTPSRGAMDPTSAGCEKTFITSLDLAAFDAMGWNLSYDVLSNAGISKVWSSGQALNGIANVPEPAMWVQLIAGFGFVGAAFRRLRRRGGKFAAA